MMRSWIEIVACLGLLLLAIPVAAQPVQTSANQTRQARSNEGTPIRQVTIPRTAKREGQVPRGVAPLVYAPNWYPLAPQHQVYLDEILTYWEHQCKTINRYQCEFQHFV